MCFFESISERTLSVKLATYRYFPSILFLTSVFLSTNSLAQVDVRDSRAANASNSNASPENSVVYEVQALQQEVLSLRGQLETLEYEIKRLKKQRLDDYLDLDKRVSELTRQLSPSAVSTQQTTSSQVPATTVTGEVAAITEPVAAINGEQANGLYNDAIDLLLNQQDYAGAQAKFTEYLTAYPKGQYTPNVYYWQGQILLADAKKQAAATHFSTLIKEYPTHQKVPDAKFKLARIYFESGKKEDAKKLLDDVALSDTDAALLAKSFISKHY